MFQRSAPSLKKLFLFYSIWLLIFVGIILAIAGYYIGISQRDAVTRQINLKLQLAQQSLGDEMYQVSQNLLILQAAFYALEKNPPQNILDVFTKLTVKVLAHRESQYNAYFALGPELSKNLFKRPGYIIATHRDAKLYGSADFYSENTFKQTIYTDPGYQKDTGEVWYHVAKKSKEIEFTEVYFDRSYMKKWLLTGGIGLYKKDHFLGMIGIDLLVDDINRKLLKIVSESPGMGILLLDDATGTILSSIDSKLECFIPNQRQYSPLVFEEKKYEEKFKNTLKTPFQVNFFNSPTKGYFLTSQAIVPATRWRVIIYQPLSDAILSIQSTLPVAILLIIVTLVIIALAWSQLKRGVLRPLDRLQNSIKELLRSSWYNRLNPGYIEQKPGQKYEEIISLVRMIEVLVKVSLRNQERNYHKMEVARLQAVHSSKMASLGQMASGIAHEINNPLSIIVGRLSQLKREVQKDVQDPIKINDIIQGIERIAFRIAKIIRSLRSFSREASGDPFEEISVSELVHETLVLCEQRMSHSKIEVKIKIYPPTLMVECQSVPISQVLVNILNNAFDAISELPVRWIEIEVRLKAESTVQFKIKDSGTGISDEVAQRIMEPFFTTKQVGEGVGLGLSISKGIVESHHGKIYLDRAEKNTTFVVEIPQYREFHALV